MTKKVVDLIKTLIASKIVKLTANITKTISSVSNNAGMINPATFTAHMATEEPDGYCPGTETFTTDDKLFKNIRKVVLEAESGYSGGTDKTFLECLKVAPER